MDQALVLTSSYFRTDFNMLLFCRTKTATFRSEIPSSASKTSINVGQSQSWARLCIGSEIEFIGFKKIGRIYNLIL